MAWHDEQHFDSLKKLCDAVDYSQRRHYEGWVFDGAEAINIQVYYPILVLQGQLWDVRPKKQGLTIKRATHLQYRRSVAGSAGEEDYQIDVIEERFLRRYLSIIAQEITKAARLLRRRHEAARIAVDKIVSAARIASTAQAKREAMEF
jgi:hypothetical protein